MANTTNFGWETPDDTDLVKDGAAAMRTLGNSIDASFVDLKGGTTGQVLAKASNTDLDFVWSADAAGISPTIFDAKGDLIAASAADTAARLAVGTNGQFLAANSSTATGLEWQTISAGGLTQLATGTLSGSSVSITSISGTYRNLYLVITRWKGNDGEWCDLQFNSDTGSKYLGNASTLSSGTGTAATSTSFQVSSQGDNGSVDGNISVTTIYEYASTNVRKMAKSFAFSNNSSTPTNYNWRQSIGFYDSTNAITSIQIIPSGGSSFTGGEYVLYGVK